MSEPDHNHGFSSEPRRNGSKVLNPSAPPQPDLLGHSLPCVHCGYDLHQLPIEGRCPECGKTVRSSLHGDWLQFCHPVWVRSLATGTLLIVFAYSIFLSFSLLRLATPTYGPGSIPPYFVLSVTGAWRLLRAVGIWLLTALEPRIAHREKPLTSRLALRALLVLDIAICSMKLALAAAREPSSTSLDWADLLLNVTITYLTFWQLRLLARRLPAPALESQTAMLLWTAPGITLIVILARALQRVIRDSSFNLSRLFPAAAGLFLIFWAYPLLLHYAHQLFNAARAAQRNSAISHAQEPPC